MRIAGRRLVVFSRLTAVSQAHFVLDELDAFASRPVPIGDCGFAHSSIFCGSSPARESVHHHTGLWCEWGGLVGSMPPTLRIPTHCATTT